MSDRARSMIWSYYEPRRWGAPIILAIALSDEADDRGGGIFQSNIELAKKTRQNERAVRRQLKALEVSKLLECVERSSGGAGNFNHYRLHLAELIVHDNPGYGPGLTRAVDPCLDGSTRAVGPGSGGPHTTTLKDLKDFFVEDGSTVRVGEETEDRRLADWIYQLLVAMNPKHRAPIWSAWCKDIRLMRERDKRTRREIAELFAWANADSFWQTNILSPGKLREKWDQLTLKRGANGGRDAPRAPAIDRSCSRLINGARCSRPGKFGRTDNTWRCDVCNEEEERDRAT